MTPVFGVVKFAANAAAVIARALADGLERFADSIDARQQPIPATVPEEWWS